MTAQTLESRLGVQAFIYLFMQATLLHRPTAKSFFWQNLTFPAEAYVERTPISQLGQPGQPHSWILTPRGRQAGLLHLGTNERLRVKMDALKQGVSTKIVGVGASITLGMGAADGHSWMVWLEKYTRAYVGNNVTFINAAKGGVTSKYHSACGMQHVPKDADIIFVEFAVNDPPDGQPPFDNVYRRAFERMLRRFLNLPSRPAVVLVLAYAWHEAGANLHSPGVFYHGAQNEMSVFAEFYGLPAVSLRACCWKLMAANITGFAPEPRWNLTSPLANVSFYYDQFHPDGRTGHRVIAELVTHLFLTTLSDLQATPLDSMDAALAAAPLPHPMILNNWESKTDRCLVGLPFLNTINQTRGFAWANDRKDPNAPPKWGLVAKQPGSSLTLLVDTRPSATLAGRAAPPSSFTLVEILHLRSYANHGRANVTCEVCKCEPTVLDGYWTSPNSQLDFHRIQATPVQDCRITVTVLGDSSAPDKGTRVKVAGIVVHEEGGHTESAAHAHFLTLEGDRYQSLWPQYIAKVGSGR